MSSSINAALVRKYLYELYQNEKIEGLEKDRLLLLLLKHLPSFQKDYLKHTLKNKLDNSQFKVKDLIEFYDDEDNYSEENPVKNLMEVYGTKASEKARFLEFIAVVKELVKTRIASETDPWDYTFLNNTIQENLDQEMSDSGEDEVKCIEFGLACNVEPMLYQFVQYTSINPLTFFRLISYGFVDMKIYQMKKDDSSSLFCSPRRNPSSRNRFLR